MATVVTRIAPSPTGLLHLGTARTALFNYLFARRYGGKFLLRIEDTDRERSRPAFEADILEGLRWLGLWPERQHPTARQSERLPLYQRALDTLIASGRAYVSQEESRRNPGSMVQVVRLRNPGGTVTFYDEIRGAVEMDVGFLGDFVIARSPTEPLYHLAVVVDDYEMGVTHVIRGEDHLSNTPRHILLQEALGIPRPRYAHLPLILAPDRSKLSKRHGAVSVREYREAGFLPEALLNALALLGWHPPGDEELIAPGASREEVLDVLASQFSLEAVQRGGAIFSQDKVRWINAQHLRHRPRTWLSRHLLAHIRDERLRQVFANAPAAFEDLLGRVSVFSDLVRLENQGELSFYITDPVELVGREALRSLILQRAEDPKATAHLFRRAQEALAHHTVWEAASLGKWVRQWADSLVANRVVSKRGAVLWPLRTALTGRSQSPAAEVVMEAIGPTPTLRRLRTAEQVVGGGYTTV